MLHESNQGVIATANEALGLVRGDYVVKLDGDDLLTPGALARSVALMEANPDVGFAYGRPIHFTGQPPPARDAVRSWTIWPGSTWLERAAQRSGNCISQPEVVMRTSAVRAAGEYCEDLPHTYDFEMFLRLAAISDVGHLVGPDQGWYRVHDASQQRTVNAGLLCDLRGRRDAFDRFFAGPGSLVNGAAEMQHIAQRELAVQALDCACHASTVVERTTTSSRAWYRVALEVDPTIVRHSLWKALQGASGSARSGAPAPAIRRPCCTAAPPTTIKLARWRRTGV